MHLGRGRGKLTLPPRTPNSSGGGWILEEDPRHREKADASHPDGKGRQLNPCDLDVTDSRMTGLQHQLQGVGALTLGAAILTPSSVALVDNNGHSCWVEREAGCLRPQRLILGDLLGTIRCRSPGVARAELLGQRKQVEFLPWFSDSDFSIAVLDCPQRTLGPQRAMQEVADVEGASQPHPTPAQLSEHLQVSWEPKK